MMAPTLLRHIERALVATGLALGIWCGAVLLDAHFVANIPVPDPPKAARASVPATEVRPAAGAALVAVMLLMIFAPKIATGLDVLLRRSSREAYGGAACFVLNVAGETLFSFLLSPVMAFAHTAFLFRLFILRRGYKWNSQTRESHVVPWSVAWAKLWPQTLIGFAVIAIIAMKALGDIVYPTGRVNQYMAYFWGTYNNVSDPGPKTGAPLMATVPFYALLGNHDVSAKLPAVPDALAAYYFFAPPKGGPGEGPWITPLGKDESVAAKFRAAF